MIRSTILAAGAAIAVCGQAQAVTFNVEQYAFWSRTLSAIESFAASNAPIATATTSIIDYTDDVRFQGDFAGFSPWPAAAASGETSTAGVNNNFSVHITTEFRVAVSDTYYFRTLTDDGVWLFIDGDPVIADPTEHGEEYNEGSIALVGGTTYTLSAWFFEHIGQASMELAARSSTGSYMLAGAPGSVILNPVPLPASLGFGVLGLAGLGFASRRR